MSRVDVTVLHKEPPTGIIPDPNYGVLDPFLFLDISCGQIKHLFQGTVSTGK